MLPPCPYCGDERRQVLVKAEIRGNVLLWFTNEDGEIVEQDNDKTYTVKHSRPICGKCNHTRRDIVLENGRIVERTPPGAGEE